MKEGAVLIKDIETEKVEVPTLRNGDEIVLRNGENDIICTVEVTWEGAAPEYWVKAPVQGRIRLASDGKVDKVVKQKAPNPDSQRKKPWWQFWKQ